MDVEVFIEELDSNEVSEAELSQFQEVKVIVQQDRDVATKEENDEETTGALIQRFVCDGKSQLPDFCIKLESDEELEELEEMGELEADPNLHAEVRDNDVATAANTSKGSALSYTSKASTSKQKHTFKQEAYYSDDDDSMMGDTSTGGRSHRVGGPRRRILLNAAQQCMMGEANLSFARGQTAIAEKICLEIIRQNPLAAQPFFTLAEIYEQSDPEKYLNFLTIAAHLNPHEREQWIRIAEVHIAQNNLTQARITFTKAIKVLPRDYDLRLRKGRMLEQMGIAHAANYTFLKMLPYMPPEKFKLCLSIAKEVARFFHGLNKTTLALTAMQTAYDICGKHFTLEDLNLYMDLLLQLKSYRRVVLCMSKHTNLDLGYVAKTEEGTDDESVLTVTHCFVPDDFVPEFRVKLYVSLIHLDARQLFDYILTTSHMHIEMSNESQLDLFIDIAEAFMQCQHYAHAYKLLHPITQPTDGRLECPAFVWLRQAECLNQLNRTDEAIESFTRVVELAPLCYKARFTLSSLLKQQGRHVEAVRVLEQPTDEDGLNPRLLYERCVMLHEIGDIDAFLEVGFTLLSRHSLLLRSREELLTVANCANAYNADSLKTILQMRNLTEDTDTAMQEYNKTSNDCADLTIQDEYELFLRLVRTAHTERKYSYAQRLCFAMMTTKRFIGYSSELERIIILACYFNDDCQLAFSFLREMVSKQQNNIALWNMMALLVQKSQELRYHRYMSRLFQRHECNRELRLFVAHYHLYCCSYKYALNAYAPLYREQQHPLVALCMAIIFNQLSLQRRVLRKTAAVSHAITFAYKYAEWRCGRSVKDADAPQPATEHCSAAQQEINYNIGRIYHQAGLLHLALEYYQRALDVQHPLLDEYEQYLGLRQEIAYNMHLIYLASGNREKARQCIYQYCVI